MTEMKISEDFFVKTRKTFIDIGQLLSFAEISCLLPTVPVSVEYSVNQPGKPVGSYTISVSNNNIDFSSTEALFIVYDSKCIECTTTTSKTCKLKSNSCSINGYCFAANEVNPKQWCEVCNPTLNPTSFSKRNNNLPPTFKKNATKLYTFHDEEWQFEIPAYDPENQTLVYEVTEITENNLGIQISPSGILSWKSREFCKHSFTIKVSDPCGLSESSKFEVETIRQYIVNVKVTQIATAKRSLEKLSRLPKVHTDSQKKHLRKQ